MDTKVCPICGETIKAAAKKCRYCLEWLDGYSGEKFWKEFLIDQTGQVVSGKQTNIGAVDGDIGQIGDQQSAVSFEGDAEVSGYVAGGDMDVQQGGVRTGDNPEFHAPVAVGDQDIQYGPRYEGEFKLGKDVRDEQHEIALNWEMRGKPNMREFDLAKRNLSDLCLAHADLRNAMLKDSFMHRIDLSHANLFMANLDFAELTEAKLHRAILTGARLCEANLNAGDLSNASLYCAKLIDAKLARSNLSNANLFGAELEGADLRDATYTDGTWWPKDFDPQAAGAIRVEDKT